jgi:hypothetical protein
MDLIQQLYMYRYEKISRTEIAEAGIDTTKTDLESLLLCGHLFNTGAQERTVFQRHVHSTTVYACLLSVMEQADCLATALDYFQ